MKSVASWASTQRIYLLLFILILVWGLSWPVAKMGLHYVSPVWFAAARLSIGTITMFTVVFLLGKLVWPSKQDWKIIIALGLLQICFFMILVCIGLSHVDAGRSAVLVYTTPIWIVPISLFIFKERPSFKKWLGFCFGLVGIFILFNPLEINWSDQNEMMGNGVLLLGALSWAIAILCARHMKWSRTPLELISWQLLIGTIPILLLAMITKSEPPMLWDATFLFSLIYCGILATAFAYWGTIVISKELPPITTSLSLLTIPICGLIFSALLLHETITLTLIVAMICILSGLLCVILDRK